MAAGQVAEDRRVRIERSHAKGQRVRDAILDDQYADLDLRDAGVEQVKRRLKRSQRGWLPRDQSQRNCRRVLRKLGRRTVDRGQRLIGLIHQRGSIEDLEVGHIRDLPAKATEVPAVYKGESWANLGIDVDNDFKALYVVTERAKKQVAKLKKLLKNSDGLYLATDEDREGEAIAWHLSNTLGLKPDNTRRIVFNEITKTAILDAIENPRNINYDLVNAQQARRVLDRLVGYELSPVLWRKVKGGLSAGRVQSVSVRLIVEREREINTFIPKQSFKTQALFLNKSNKPINSFLPKNFDSEELTQKFLEKNKNYDLNDYKSENFEVYINNKIKMDHVITVCNNANNEICPIWPKQNQIIHWDIDDPVSKLKNLNDEEKQIIIRKTFNEINKKINSWVKSEK